MGQGSASSCYSGERISIGCDPRPISHLPNVYPNTPGVLYQSSTSGTTGRPELALDSTQITRWVLELSPEIIRAKFLSIL